MYHCVYVECAETFRKRLGVELPAGSLWCVVHEEELPDAATLRQCGHGVTPFGPDRPDYSAVRWDGEKLTFVARGPQGPQVSSEEAQEERGEERGASAPFSVRGLLARLTGRGR